MRGKFSVQLTLTKKTSVNENNLVENKKSFQKRLTNKKSYGKIRTVTRVGAQAFSTSTGVLLIRKIGNCYGSSLAVHNGANSIIIEAERFSIVQSRSGTTKSPNYSIIGPFGIFIF